MAKKKLPRFVLSVVDTKHQVHGPKGLVYYNITVGFHSIEQLLKPIESHQGHPEDGENELMRVLQTFEQTSINLDGEAKAKREEPK